MLLFRCVGRKRNMDENKMWREIKGWSDKWRRKREILKKKKKNSFMLLYEKVQNFIPLKCKNVKKKSLFDFFILFYEI